MIILKSLPVFNLVAAGMGGSGLGNLLTPDPKEVFATFAVGNTSIDIDLGSPQEVDCVFVGFTNGSADASWDFYTSTSPGQGNVSAFNLRPLRAADSLGPRHHGFQKLAAPVTSRYFRLRLLQGGATPLQAGILMLGKAFSCPYEFGGGRQPVDTGAKEPLLGGGFGIGEGVVKAALRWTFVDLDGPTRRGLWALVAGVGETRPVVVHEETGDAAGLNEEIHYGLFDRFEPYERQAPGMTRWALSMTEWV